MAGPDFHLPVQEPIAFVALVKPAVQVLEVQQPWHLHRFCSMVLTLVVVEQPIVVRALERKLELVVQMMR